MQINKISSQLQVKTQNPSFKATLPPKNAMTLEQNYWLDFYLRCKKQNKIAELENLLGKLKTAGDGILCLLRPMGNLPRFVIAKDTENICDILKQGENCCTRMLKLNKDSEGYHSNAVIKPDLEFEEKLNTKDETTAILNILSKIVTRGSKENEFLFLNEAQEFYDKFK